ncbi:MAG: glycosyltransferase family 4 protein, partial [Muribaculaceae bacterium]|nr:glycosyltransferase family 4 protein [Muribaculaceae bacterium]
MKILLVHNDYGKYSGEEAVVDRMAAMLSAHGHEVAQLRMTSAGSRESLLGKIHGFAAGIYSPSGVKAMRETLRREKPDVVNVHNLYPFISPAALKECRKAGVPVVMTIHNFRLICPTGLFMRDGGPCELCLQRGNEWGCVRHNCEHSMMKSVGYAARNAVARLTGAYRQSVTRFSCITDFQRRKLIAAGFDAGRITVIPNAVDLGADKEYTKGDYVAYCGRLSYEKGLDLILEVARRHPEIRFRLAGACRDQELISDLPSNVKLAGYLAGSDLQEFYRNASFFVMASRWYEGFPMAILEAAQYSKPTIGPDHGGFTEIIGKDDDAIGRLFAPASIDDLEQQIVELWNAPDQVQALGMKARTKLQQQYSSEVIYNQ